MSLNLMEQHYTYGIFCQGQHVTHVMGSALNIDAALAQIAIDTCINSTQNDLHQSRSTHALLLHVPHRCNTHNITVQRHVMPANLFFYFIQVCCRPPTIPNLQKLNPHLVSRMAPAYYASHMLLKCRKQNPLITCFPISYDNQVERFEITLIAQDGQVSIKDCVDPQTQGGTPRGLTLEKISCTS